MAREKVQKTHWEPELSRIPKRDLEKASNAPAARVLKKLAGEVKDNPLVLAIIEADPNPTKGVIKLINLLKDPENSRKSLNTLAKQADVPVFEVFHSYASGIQRLGHDEAISVLSEKMLTALESLFQQAVPKRVTCPTCRGEKRDEQKKLCLACGGDGEMEQLPKFWAFAQKTLWNITGLLNDKKGAGLTIHNQVQNNSGNKTANVLIGGSLVERLASLSDEVIHKSQKALKHVPQYASEILSSPLADPIPVEAEIIPSEVPKTVLPKDHPEEIRPSGADPFAKAE